MMRENEKATAIVGSFRESNFFCGDHIREKDVGEPLKYAAGDFMIIGG